MFMCIKLNLLFDIAMKVCYVKQMLKRDGLTTYSIDTRTRNYCNCIYAHVPRKKLSSKIKSV